MLAEYVSPAGRRACAGEEGLTLVEIMIAAFLLAVAILGLASVATTSLISVRESRERDRATAAASSALEAARALPYGEIALTGTDWQTDPLVEADGPSWVLDHDGDGSHTEPLWATSSGAIDPYHCTWQAPDECWFEMPLGTRVDVRTFVTSYESGGDPAAAKRITVVTTWVDDPTGGRQTVHMSTVVADADRGLPAPDFEVVPLSLSTQLDPPWIVGLAEAGEAHCFAHTLSNFGSPDSYEIVLAPTPAEDVNHGWQPALDVVTSGRWYNDYWYFFGYFVPNGLSKGDAGTLMLPDPDAADDHVVTPSQLLTDPPDNSAELHLCYEPRSSADGGTSPAADEPPFVFSYAPTVRSKFDFNVVTTLEHTVRVGALDRLHLLYGMFDCEEPGDCDWFEHLHDIGGTSTYTRPAADRVGGVFSFAPLPMVPEAPPDVTMPHYDAWIHHDGNNFEHNTGTTGRVNRPGMFMPLVDLVVAGTTQPRETFAIEWDWQFDDETAPVSYVGDVELVNLVGVRHPDGTAPAGQLRWCLTTQLLKFQMDADGSLPDTPVVAGERLQAFVPGGGGWRPLIDYTVPWSGGGASFQPGDVLRLRIANAGVGAVADAECARLHLGFGVMDPPGGPDQPAAIVFEVAE